MKIYSCQHCQNKLYFENSHCLKCGYKVGFDPYQLRFITFYKDDDNNLVNVKNRNERFKFCKNVDHYTCNWLLASNAPQNFCRACELNHTIPQLANGENLDRWKLIEIAKHRLIYSLLRMNLPLKAKKGKEMQGIAFKFVETLSPEKRIMTGHKNGVITINIEEADEKLRVRNKLDLGEKYRTLLGHFRHEVGHYYWDVLIKNSPKISDFRWHFGNENEDYGKAISTYYKNGAPANWQSSFISQYASSHPWEDWAECWANYLHMMDTLETAYSFGMKLFGDQQQIKIDMDPYLIKSFDDIFDMWLPLTFATNSLTRSMGHTDFYPFVISKTVKKKLAYIHELCLSNRMF